MTQLEYHHPNLAPDPNRRTRLLVMGILITLAGGAVVAVIGATIIFLISSQYTPPLKELLLLAIVYSAVAAAMIWMGIGSILKKRWSRPVILAGAGVWLSIGFSELVSEFAASTRYGEMLFTPGSLLILGIVCAITIVCPLVVILMLRPASVQQTLDYYDPRPRWTDTRPISIIGLSFLLAAASCFFAFEAFDGIVYFFGTIVHGRTARFIMIALAVGFALAGFLVLQYRRTGWWIACVLGNLAAVSAVLTLGLASNLSMQDSLGWGSDAINLEYSAQVIARKRIGGIVWAALLACIAAGYLAQTRKRFGVEEVQSQSEDLVPAGADPEEPIH